MRHKDNTTCLSTQTKSSWLRWFFDKQLSISEQYRQAAEFSTLVCDSVLCEQNNFVSGSFRPLGQDNGQRTLLNCLLSPRPPASGQGGYFSEVLGLFFLTAPFSFLLSSPLFF